MFSLVFGLACPAQTQACGFITLPLYEPCLFFFFFYGLAFFAIGFPGTSCSKVQVLGYGGMWCVYLCIFLSACLPVYLTSLFVHAST